MPQGMFVDHLGNIWLTDIAMHQIFKYDVSTIRANQTQATLALGTPFQPGSDKNHFCKPSAVLFVPTVGGMIYVADECNHRIVLFDSTGRYITHYGNS